MSSTLPVTLLVYLLSQCLLDDETCMIVIQIDQKCITFDFLLVDNQPNWDCAKSKAVQHVVLYVYDHR